MLLVHAAGFISTAIRAPSGLTKVPSQLTVATSFLLLLAQKFSTYMKLARIHNLVPSVILVMVGAWVSTVLKMCKDSKNTPAQCCSRILARQQNWNTSTTTLFLQCAF